MPKITVHGGPSNAGEAAGSPAVAASPAPALPAAEGEPAAAVTDDYATWTVDELRDELRGRLLPVSGAKAELVARLEAADQADEGVIG